MTSKADIKEAVVDSLELAIAALRGDCPMGRRRGWVGNESRSQFSREYNRMFGAPPLGYHELVADGDR